MACGLTDELLFLNSKKQWEVESAPDNSYIGHLSTFIVGKNEDKGVVYHKKYDNNLSIDDFSKNVKSGGSCTCPDGEILWAAEDGFDDCKNDLLCENGEPGTCEILDESKPELVKNNTKYKGKKAICAKKRFKNPTRKNHANDAGGTCKCPDGVEYHAADQNSCETVLCSNGGVKAVCDVP